MARWSSWFVASLVLALLFVTSDCLRGSNTHVEGQSMPAVRSRGSSRFNASKVEKRLETTPVPFTAQSRSNRRSNFATNRVTGTLSRQIKSNDATKIYTTSEISTIGQLTNPVRRRGDFTGRQHTESVTDLTRSATEDRRYLPEPSTGKKNLNGDDNSNLQVPHESTRTINRQSNGSLRSRTSNAAAERRIDTTSPSAYGSDIPRSRTGRKIQPTASARNFRVSTQYESNSGVSDHRRSIESEERSRTTSQRPLKQSRERNVRKNVIVSSNIEENNNFPTETTTNRPQEKISSKSKIVNDTQSQKIRTPSSRNNRRGSSNVNDERELSRKKLREHSELESTIRDVKNGVQRNTTQLRNRGRNLENRKSTTEKTRNVKKHTRTIDESKITELNNDITNLSARSRSRSRNATSSTKTTTESYMNRKSSTTQPEISTEIDIETTTIISPALQLNESTTNPPPSVRKAPIIPSRASSNPRRAAASSLSIKTLPKEDFFNHGIGFRGRKFNTGVSQIPSVTPETRNNQQTTPSNHGNPGWTLHRRPIPKNENIPVTTSTVSTISNEIPSSNDEKTSLANPSPRRGNKIFNKASIILKIDREVDDADNYPPEFKAKIAKLKNSGVKDGGSKLFSSANKDDDPMRHVIVINRRQLRSTDNGKPEDTESQFYPEVITINPITTVPMQPNNSDMLDVRNCYPLNRKKNQKQKNGIK